MFLFHWNLGHIETSKNWQTPVFKKKKKIEKPALRIIVLLIKSVFYVNNLNSSITNTTYVIFVPTHCGYFTNSPVYLTAIPSPSTTSDNQFLFANNNFFYWQTFFSCFFLCFYWLFFWFQFCFFLFWYNLIFVNLGYLFLALLQFSFQKWANNECHVDS